MQRLNDARFGDGDVSDIKRYIRLGCLGQAFTAEAQVVLLIDEIDKADPKSNDLLNELDEMSFYILEMTNGSTLGSDPLSSSPRMPRRNFPDAFLRRCVFHYITYPGPELMT